MNRFCTTAILAAATFGLVGGVLFLTSSTELLAQDKKKTDGKKKGLDLGVVNLDKLNKADLAVPAKDDKTLKVGLKATVTGHTAKDEKLNVIVAICPISSADAKDVFFVQKLKRDGDKFSAPCQFGEGDAGKGEYFVVIAFTSKNDLGDGVQMSLAEIQSAATAYSAVLMVKRRD